MQPFLMILVRLCCRFPSAVKASKSCKKDATSARGSLTSTKQLPIQVDAPASAQPQPGVDSVR